MGGVSVEEGGREAGEGGGGGGGSNIVQTISLSGYFTL